MATNAGNEAQNADTTAQGASGHVDRLNTTVNGLDQYHQATEVEITFHGGQPDSSAAARKQLDDFAANLTGRKGYIVEVEGYSPLAGNTGIQSSRRLTEAVNRYLVVEHEIPVYRLRSVALGNAPVTGMDSDSDETKPVKVSCVRIRLMENTLAAREAASPHGATSSTGAETALKAAALPPEAPFRSGGAFAVRPPIHLSNNERTKAIWPPLITGAVFCVPPTLT